MSVDVGVDLPPGIADDLMQDVPHPFTITTFYSGKDKPEDVFSVNEGTPVFRDLLFSNITARGAKEANAAHIPA